MADAVWDLQKAMRAPAQDARGRSDSDPGRLQREQAAAAAGVNGLAQSPASSAAALGERKALEIAVPGGFRRHHVEQAPKRVSKALRDQIVDKIESVYNPFIGNILSQDDDKYDEMEVKERAESLLQTPIFKLPYRRAAGSKDAPAPSESTRLMAPEPSYSPRRGESEKTTTLWHALLTLLKAFVGTGILFLPDGFRSGGILFSPLCLTVVAALTLYAMLRLLQCRALVGGTYGHVGFVAYGIWGKRMVQISIILMQAGFCCTYVIFVAQNMQQVLAFCGATVSTSTLIVLQVAVYIPLSWIRYISYFSISNLIADIFILYGLAFIVSNSAELLATDGVQHVELFNAQDYPVFIGTAIFTFEGIGLVLPTQSSLNAKRQAKFPALLVATVLGLLVFYSAFAGINYLALGARVQPMVTSSLPRTGWSISVQFGYSVAQLLSYPLFLFPAVKIMEEMLGFPKRASGKKVAKNCFRALAVVVTVSIAYFGQNRLDLFVSIVGAFCCVPLSFVYPPLFYLKLTPKPTLTEKLADSFVIVLGVLTFFYVTYSNLSKWAA